MDKIRIPKFDNETDEGNWAYEHREELAEAFMNQDTQQEEKRASYLEVAPENALETKDLTAPEELFDCTLVSAPQKKLAHR
jgi:hypothetical protein